MQLLRLHLRDLEGNSSLHHHEPFSIGALLTLNNLADSAPRTYFKFCWPQYDSKSSVTTRSHCTANHLLVPWLKEPKPLVRPCREVPCPHAEQRKLPEASLSVYSRCLDPKFTSLQLIPGVANNSSHLTSANSVHLQLSCPTSPRCRATAQRTSGPWSLAHAQCADQAVVVRASWPGYRLAKDSPADCTLLFRALQRLHWRGAFSSHRVGDDH
mmetsp:Transcript_124479/g.225964  ORF Transcript_124479/g.225964 Transcript_124479/m.225964 type:complete len:213 (+) Transcript_124479:937-1575(+)